MARRRRGSPIHGWVVIDKPGGLTSAHVVAKVRAILDAAKAGHAGTLDPLATGVLPIALGEATKTVSYVMEGRKAYRFTVRWGEARDTDDAEGEVTQTSLHRPSGGDIRGALAAFIGVIEQSPPRYSAVKIDGRRSYELARANEPAEPGPRPVWIESFDLVDTPDADQAVFHVRCGKGAYVRRLARDLAERLGTVGHVTEIRRLAAGPFDESDAISLDNLAALRHSAPPQDYLLPIEAALDDIPALALTDIQAEYLRHGRTVRVRDTGGRPFVEIGDLDEGDMLFATAAGRPVALARLHGDEIRPVRVLNL